jgi:hypothetical protein
VHVSPRDNDRFHLRVLLCNRKGPTSYEDLRTVDGVTTLFRSLYLWRPWLTVGLMPHLTSRSRQIPFLG